MSYVVKLNSRQAGVVLSSSIASNLNELLSQNISDEEVAEDLLQEVLVRAMEGVRRYRSDGPFKSWLFGIATHACLDLLTTWSEQQWPTGGKLIVEWEHLMARFQRQRVSSQREKTSTGINNTR